MLNKLSESEKKEEKSMYTGGIGEGGMHPGEAIGEPGKVCTLGGMGEGKLSESLEKCVHWGDGRGGHASRGDGV